MLGKNITDAEFEEMKKMLIAGKTYKEIAEQFSRSRKTIEAKFLKTGANKLFRGVEKSCKECGEEFLVTDRTNIHKRKFCTDQCKSRHNRRDSGTYELICVTCKGAFRTYNKKTLNCSDECYKKYKVKKSTEAEVNRNRSKVMKIYKYNCPVCKGKGYTKYKKKYCSEYCKDKAQRLKRIEYETKPKKCIECGKWFSTHTTNALCSVNCRRKHSNRRREFYKRRRGKMIRFNGRVDEDISVERLIKRDKGLCYLCGKKVDTTKHFNHNLYPTIEHVKPIITGGTHTWENVKLSHRICNTLKGIGTEEEYKRRYESISPKPQ